MKKFFIYGVVFVIVLFPLFYACNNPESSQNYKTKIDKWHRQRIKDLTKPDSWLSLAGLYWLKQGANTFGADSTNDVIFPANRAPAYIGKFVLNDSTITVSIAPNVPVLYQQKKFSRMKMKTDEAGDPTILRLGSLSWYIIKRSGHYAVRLKDNENAVLHQFDGIDRYPVKKQWRVRAKFIPYDHPETLKIPTITGKPTEVVVPGELAFTIDGESYRLWPFTVNSNNNKFFVIFGDETNGEKTYGGGRYVYVSGPGKDNITYIDFNKAYNPPCVFTKFATCPLPPSQNRLSVAITAGEKISGLHHQNY